MQTPESPPVDFLLKDVDSAVRNAVRRKLRVTLRASDGREQNLDALDLLQEIRLKLIRRLSAETSEASVSSVHEFTAYAVTVAYRACSDYLRAKYPKRTSLKNCLRRVLDKTSEYACWETADGECMCGFAGWKSSSFRPNSARIRELGMNPNLLPKECLPAEPAAGLKLVEWKRLLDGVFHFVDGPVPLDEVIAIVAPVVGMEDVPDAGPRDDEDAEERGLDRLASRDPSPYSERLTGERLKLFWGAVLKLLAWHRVAYLLNFRDGDLEALPLYGVATIEQIGDALELTGQQFGILARELAATEPTGARRTPGQRFLFYWRYLPLEDNLIAAVLGVTREQVISYRSKAKERLKRMLQGM